MLASRGADPALRDDIAQEVAVRALDKQVPFTDPDDLYRWAAVTARHLHIDHLRTGGRTTTEDALLTVADPTDVAHAAERRVALEQVWHALAELRSSERDAILDGLRFDSTGAATSQALVRRHRARATLRRAVGGMIVALTTWRIRLRTLTESVSPAMRAASAVAVLTPMIAYEAIVIGAPHGSAPVRQTPPAVLREATTSRPAGSAQPPATLHRPVPAGVGPAPSPDGSDQQPPQETRVDTQAGDLVVDHPSPSSSPTVFCVEGIFDLPRVCSPV